MTCHFYLLISNILFLMVYLLIRKCYENFLKLNIISFQKTVNCLVPHLTDKHKIYWVCEYATPQTFVDIDYLLNYIGLKLLQPIQDSVHTLHSLYYLLLFLYYQIISFIVSGACNSSLYPCFIIILYPSYIHLLSICY